MKKLFTALFALCAISAFAQRPFASFYSGASISKATTLPVSNFRGGVVYAARLEGGVSFINRFEVGLQVNVQPWRFATDISISDINGRPLGTLQITADRGSPTATLLAFARYTSQPGFRVGAGLGYSRTFGEAGPTHYTELELEPGTLTVIPISYRSPTASGFATSAQLGYKRALVRGFAVAVDAIGVYSAMRAEKTLLGPAFNYGNLCLSLTAGVQYRF